MRFFGSKPQPNLTKEVLAPMVEPVWRERYGHKPIPSFCGSCGAALKSYDKPLHETIIVMCSKSGPWHDFYVTDTPRLDRFDRNTGERIEQGETD